MQPTLLKAIATRAVTGQRFVSINRILGPWPLKSEMFCLISEEICGITSNALINPGALSFLVDHRLAVSKFGEMFRKAPYRKASSIGEAHKRPESVRGRHTHKIQPRYRGLEIGR